MKRLALLLTALFLMVPSTASAHETINGTVSPGAPFTWSGTRAIAANITGFTTNNNPECGEDVDNFCEFIHLTLNLPFPAGSTATKYKKTASVRIDAFDPAVVTDFDMGVYYSDASGTMGERILYSAQSVEEGNDRPEEVTVPLESKRTYNPDGTVASEITTHYLLAQVVYFFCPNSAYSGTAKFL